MKKYLNTRNCAFWVPAVLLAVFLIFAHAAGATEDPRPRRTGLKIEVAGDGIVRVTGQAMIGAGIDIGGIDPAYLRMFHRNREIPVVVSGDGSHLAAGDAVLFYAPGLDNRYTETDAFWLYWGGSTPGMRMDGAAGAPSGSAGVVDVFEENLRFEQNRLMWPGVPGAPEADYWFWERLTSPQAGTYRFDIPAMAGAGGNAAVRVFLQGRGAGPHDVAVRLNGAALGSMSWSGNQAHARTFTFTQSRLKSLGNELTLDYHGNTGGMVYVNSFEVGYQRRIEAHAGRIAFGVDLPAGRNISVSGFDNRDIYVFDVTDPAAPVRMDGVDVRAHGAGFRAVFAHPGGKRDWVAIAGDRAISPSRVAARAWSGLKNTDNQADYILITSEDLAPALEKLLELRRRQGLKTFVASVEDIYDVFSFGRFDPGAIRDFLAYAWRNWQRPAPQFVLLAGDANLDYRNYYGTSKQNIVPGLLVPDPDLGLIPSDNPFACVSGSTPVPDLHIGRIPGNSRQIMADIANKIILYESDRHRDSNQVLLTADKERVFEDLSDELAGIAAPGFSARKVYARDYGRAADVTADIASAVNSGAALTGYVGHGDVTRWGVAPFGDGASIFAPGDLKNLTNSRRLTVMVALNCLNGYFSQPFHYSLAEEWVMAPGRGAVAAFAPAGLSYLWEHERLGIRFFERLFKEGENRLGPLAVGAKIDAYAAGVSGKVLTSFNLIGDPATRIAVNRGAGDVERVHIVTAEASAGGRIFPGGDVPVFRGEPQTFTIAPNTGYRIRSVTVDGREVAVEEIAEGEEDAAQSELAEYRYKYRFAVVAADHDVKVVFEREGGSGGGGGGGGGGGSTSACFIGAAALK